jgi:hypothetical protein
MAFLFSLIIIAALNLHTISVQAITAPTALSCLNYASNGTLYSTTSNSTYLVLCATDYAGGDVSAITAKTFEDCIDACDLDQRCIDVSYLGNACYLKSKLGTASHPANVWTAERMLGSPRTYLTCDNNRSNGTFYLGQSGVYQVQCGMDYTGGRPHINHFPS